MIASAGAVVARLRAWAAPVGLAAAIAVAVLLAVVADAPPAPAGVDAPAREFSEGRARPIVAAIAARGPHVHGSPALAAAAADLATRLRAIGLEVEVVDAAGTAPSPWFPDEIVDYRVQNVVARLHGREPGSIVLGAHYDAAPASPGASDDGAGVAVVIEVARALAARPAPRHDVVFVLDGAEEVGLVGAVAFRSHPWAAGAIAFVNLDAAGAGGRSILFRGAAGDGLVELYAAVAPHPHASVVGADLMAAGLIPSDTNYRALASGGLPGLDLALYRDGWAYHTALDRADRLEPGALQHLGDDVLAVVAALAERGAPEHLDTPTVYYDVLGVVMFSYGRGVALALALLVVLAVGAAIALARQRGLVTVRTVAMSAAAWLGTLVAALIAGVVIAVLLGIVLGRPHGWYASPALAAFGYGAIALVPAALLRARRRAASAPAAWAGALVAWTLLLVAGTALGVGVSYVAMWWALPGAAALAVIAAARTRPRGIGDAPAPPVLADEPAPSMLAVTIAALIPGLIVTVELVRMLVTLFVPVAGRLPLGVPLDGAIALIVALPLAPAAWMVTSALPGAGPRRGLAATVGGLAVLAAVALAATAPYDARHPKRVAVEHRDDSGGARVSVTSFDALPADALARAAAAGPSAPLPYPAATVDVVRTGRHARLTLVAPGATSLAIKLPVSALAGWSLPVAIPTAGTYVAIRVLAPAAAGWSVDLDLTTDGQVAFDVIERYDAASTPALDAVAARLPAWVQPMPEVVRRRAHGM